MLLSSGSFSSGVVTITVACVGAGILTFPEAFMSAGVGLSLVFLAIVGVLTVMSLRFLATGVEFLGLGSYEEMARELLGSRWETFVRLVLFSLNYGAMAAFITVLKEMLVAIQPQLFPVTSRLGAASLVPHALLCKTIELSGGDTSSSSSSHRHASTNPPCTLSGDGSASSFVAFFTLSNPTFLLVIMWCLFMLPMSLFRTVDSLRFATTLSIGASAFLTFCIIIRYVYPEDALAASEGGHIVIVEALEEAWSTTPAPPHSKPPHDDKSTTSIQVESSKISTHAPSTTTTSAEPTEEATTTPRHAGSNRERPVTAIPERPAVTVPPTMEEANLSSAAAAEDEEGPHYGNVVASLNDDGAAAASEGDQQDGDTPVNPEGDDAAVDDRSEDAPPERPATTPTRDKELHEEHQARGFDFQQAKKERQTSNKKKSNAQQQREQHKTKTDASKKNKGPGSPIKDHDDEASSKKEKTRKESGKALSKGAPQNEKRDRKSVV